MNTPKKIGRVFRNLRISHGLSQEQLSTQSGVDQHYISNIENGQRNPSVEMIEHLATFYGYTLSRFFIEVETLEDTEPTFHNLNGTSDSNRFSKFMLNQNLSYATAKKYSENVPNCSSVRAIIGDVTSGRTDDLYHILDEHELESIIKKVSESEFDKVGQRMYSCGLKKYLSFLKGRS